MKPLIFALAMMSTATLTTAYAQTYQWKDSTGRTVISDTPPPGAGRSAKTISTKPAASDETGRTAELPKSMAEREMEFKKRQLEAKEKADKENKEKEASAEKKENCLRARNQLASLESGQRISSTDANGERRFMEDSERKQEIDRTRKFLAESCK